MLLVSGCPVSISLNLFLPVLLRDSFDLFLFYILFFLSPRFLSPHWHTTLPCSFALLHLFPAIAEVTAPLNSPSSSEPVLTAANGEPGRGIAINRKESLEMVDTGTSASPPAAFSMPDLSSSMKASDLVRKSSDDSSVALRKVQATVNAKDYPETLPCITQPSPPILRSFKEVMSNSTANTKHRNSQEDSEKSEDSDELAKEYEKEYDIIHTPPDEVPAN